MDIETLTTRLSTLGVIPVVNVDVASDGPGLAMALADGGLPVVEVTFRTDAAADAIAAIRDACPGVLVGAGTVLDAATVDRAAEAGAAFIVAPGFSAEVVERSRAHGLAVIPGVVTPTEIERALASGIRLVKFFPAEAAGGTRYLRAVSAPYREIRFLPTGGVTAANLAEYLEVPSVTACGGTWIAPADAIREHRWEEIRTSAARAAAIVASLRGG